MGISEANLTLSDIIGITDEANTLWRTFLQIVEDNGGNKDHVIRLLKDARGDRKILTRLAKDLMGGIWQLTEKPQVLTFLDLNCPVEDFREKYTGIIEFTTGMTRDWDNKIPEGIIPSQHEYHLVHLGRVLFEAVQKVGTFGGKPNQNFTLAGERELVAYTSRIHRTRDTSDLSGFAIAAPGEFSVDVKNCNETTFPMARFGGKKSEIFHGKIKRPETTFLPKNIFYLVRSNP